MVNVFKALYNAGRETATAGLVEFFKSGKEETDGSEENAEMKGGMAALAIGGVLKALGVTAVVVAAIAAIVSPLTLPAVAAYGALGLMGASGLSVGMGLEQGGDDRTGLLTFRKELRHGIAMAMREDFKAWREKKLGKSFMSAASQKPAVGTRTDSAKVAGWLPPAAP